MIIITVFHQFNRYYFFSLKYWEAERPDLILSSVISQLFSH